MQMEKTITSLVLIRKNRAITQDTLSKEMKKSRRLVSFLENGKKPLSIDLIGKYLGAIQIIPSQQKITTDELNTVFEAILLDAIDIIGELLAIHIPYKQQKESTENGSTVSLKIGNKILYLQPKIHKHIKDEYMRKLFRLYDQGDIKTINIFLKILESNELLNMIRSFVSIPTIRRSIIFQTINTMRELISPNSADSVESTNIPEKSSQQNPS
jgi:transcriptional regulator with XRE-family HTH domain